MSTDAAYEEGVVKIPPQGGLRDDGMATVEGSVWRLVCPPLEDAFAESGLQEMETYVSDHQNTVAQYIATRPIMGLCLAAKQRPGPRVEIRWRKIFQTGN